MRVVLDTNVVVSALLFRKGSLACLRELWSAERFRPLTDRACTEELVRVLAYPKFRLQADDITSLLEEYLPFTEIVAEQRRRVRTPRCRDVHDRKFLDLAAAGRADVLVTGDEALLELSSRVRFAIESPREFLARFAAGASG